MTIKKVELEIEYARLAYRMDSYTERKFFLESKIKEFQDELTLCEDEISKIGVDLMAASIKLAKTRGKN